MISSFPPQGIGVGSGSQLRNFYTPTVTGSGANIMWQGTTSGATYTAATNALGVTGA